MSKVQPASLSDVLSLFENSVSCSDILSSKCLSTISSAIVKKRISLNLSQKDFANKLGVSQSMISKWEGEDYNFSIKTLADVATKLNMTLNVNLTDNYETDEQYTTGNNYNIVVSSKPTSFKYERNKVISFSKYQSNLSKSENTPKEM